MALVAPAPWLESPDAAVVLRAVRGLAGSVVAELEQVVDRALHGEDEAARRYVDAYRRLLARLLADARSVLPERVVADGDRDRLAVAEAGGRPSRALVDALEHGAAEAPFSPWTAARPLADGVVLDLVARVRAVLGAGLLPAASGHPRLPEDDLGAQRFVRRVRFHLDHPGGQPLIRVMETFALSKAELGRLFGVSRQAIDGWLRQSVPADRQEKLAAVLAVADLLGRKLKADRVAGVARRPAAAYGGATMLELIAADRHRELLASVRDSFDWSRAA